MTKTTATTKTAKTTAPKTTKATKATAPKTALTKEEREAKKQALAELIESLSADAIRDVVTRTSEMGMLMAKVDEVLASLADEVVKTGEDKALWSLSMTPVTVTVDKQKRQWIEVSGLDRNARVQLTDDGNGNVIVHVTPLKAKQPEAKAYFEAVVSATKELTIATTLRKAVAGHNFRQVWTIAQKLRSRSGFRKSTPTTALQQS